MKINVGDLVEHKGTGKTYIVVDTSARMKAMVAINRSDGSPGWMARNWLKVVQQSRSAPGR